MGGVGTAGARAEGERSCGPRGEVEGGSSGRGGSRTCASAAFNASEPGTIGGISRGRSECTACCHPYLLGARKREAASEGGAAAGRRAARRGAAGHLESFAAPSQPRPAAPSWRAWAVVRSQLPAPHCCSWSARASGCAGEGSEQVSDEAALATPVPSVGVIERAPNGSGGSGASGIAGFPPSPLCAPPLAAEFGPSPHAMSACEMSSCDETNVVSIEDADAEKSDESGGGPRAVIDCSVGGWPPNELDRASPGAPNELLRENEPLLLRAGRAGGRERAERLAGLGANFALALPPVLEPHLDLPRGHLQVVAQPLARLDVRELLHLEDLLEHREPGASMCHRGAERGPSAAPLARARISTSILAPEAANALKVEPTR